MIVIKSKCRNVFTEAFGLTLMLHGAIRIFKNSHKDENGRAASTRFCPRFPLAVLH